jgi:hypothetical protein
MDYRIYRNKNELESTGYIEIGPGKYTGAHWQEGFLFVWEDAFGMAEGILAKHLPEYDHLSMNDLPRNIGRFVTAEWRDAARRLAGMSPKDVRRLLNLGASYGERLDDEVIRHCANIAGLLSELADACDGFYERNEWVCVMLQRPEFQRRNFVLGAARRRWLGPNRSLPPRRLGMMTSWPSAGSS